MTGGKKTAVIIVIVLLGIAFVCGSAFALYQIGVAWFTPAQRFTYDIKEPGSLPLPVVTAEGVMSLNQASREDFMTIPGIGGVTADAIIAFREKYSPVYYIEDLLCVRGIGPAKLETLRNFLATGD